METEKKNQTDWADSVFLFYDGNYKYGQDFSWKLTISHTVEAKWALNTSPYQQPSQNFLHPT